MLGASAGHIGTSGDRVPAAGEGQESGGASGGSSEVGGPSPPINPGDGGLEESDRSGVGGGNRWPRQETLALLKIRSDMAAVFRDASLKGPLWEEVSRKMAELGFKRSAKKCKEKFENVYKYHKRTKDGRSSKPDGKSYRFFDQLEAFEAPAAPPPPRPPPMPALRPPPPPSLQIPTTINVSSSAASPTPLTIIPPIPNNPIITMNPSPFPPQTTAPPPAAAVPPMMHAPFPSSSSTSSDEDMQLRRQRRSGGQKRKWKDYFEGLVGEVVRKQEEMQNRFLEALERRERERAARDESWRAQEAVRMSREHELLARERSAAAVKDKAMLALLQKVAHDHNLQIPIIPENHSNPPPAVVGNPQPLLTVPSSRQPPAAEQTEATTLQMIKMDVNNSGGGAGNDIGVMQASSSRWPKAEVQALIKLRTSLDVKYQENGPKGPLWEEISAAMGKMGYSRSAKRCKEKWENINKYYKKVKESNKRRPEDSKTCPYFHQLEEIYKEKAVTHIAGVPEYGPRPNSPMPPIMARPEQQWPLSQQQQGDSLMMHGHESNHIQEDDDEDDDLDDDEDEGGAYEVMASKQPQPLQQPSSLANAAD